MSTPFSLPHCWICGSSFSLQLVGNLIDSSTTETYGYATSYNFAQNGMTPTMFYANTSSALARRFRTPGFRGQPSVGKLMLWWLGATFTWALIAHLNSGIEFTSWAMWWIQLFQSVLAAMVPGFLIAMLLMWILYRISMATRSTQRWNTAMHILRYSYYCHMCDVVFYENTVSRPEIFIRLLFKGDVRNITFPVGPDGRLQAQRIG